MVNLKKVEVQWVESQCEGDEYVDIFEDANGKHYCMVYKFSHMEVENEEHGFDKTDDYELEIV